jgi:hypothetical protein
MTAYVTIKSSFPYLGDQHQGWGFEIELNISSVVMDNNLYYTVAWPLRLRRAFMDGILDIRKDVNSEYNNKPGPGERGPDILFTESQYGFQTEDSARTACERRISSLTKELDEVAALVNGQGSPNFETRDYS